MFKKRTFGINGLFKVNVEWSHRLSLILDSSSLLMILHSLLCLLSTISMFWTSCTAWFLTNMDLKSHIFYCLLHLTQLEWHNLPLLLLPSHVLFKLFWTNPWCIKTQWFIKYRLYVYYHITLFLWNHKASDVREIIPEHILLEITLPISIQPR